MLRAACLVARRSQAADGAALKLLSGALPSRLGAAAEASQLADEAARQHSRHPYSAWPGRPGDTPGNTHADEKWELLRSQVHCGAPPQRAPPSGRPWPARAQSCARDCAAASPLVPEPASCCPAVQGYDVNPCNSKLHPAVTEAGIVPESEEVRGTVGESVAS
jgi:hypothetical protein